MMTLRRSEVQLLLWPLVPDPSAWVRGTEDGFCVFVRQNPAPQPHTFSLYTPEEDQSAATASVAVAAAAAKPVVMEEDEAAAAHQPPPPPSSSSWTVLEPAVVVQQQQQQQQRESEREKESSSWSWAAPSTTTTTKSSSPPPMDLSSSAWVTSPPQPQQASASLDPPPEKRNGSGPRVLPYFGGAEYPRESVAVAVSGFGATLDRNEVADSFGPHFDRILGCRVSGPGRAFVRFADASAADAAIAYMREKNPLVVCRIYANAPTRRRLAPPMPPSSPNFHHTHHGHHHDHHSHSSRR